mmetsp:Transcript_37102/g.89268  ORF Transcript_37102/g.89268 Transcript_37102/m.89268 type:complete len:505 (-) Transcript_37102:80-1594(-)
MIGGVLQYGCVGILREGMTSRIRSAVLKHMLRMELGFHDDPDHSPAKLAFALQTFAFRASNMMSGLGAYAGIFGALAVGIVLGFTESWQMTLMMLAAIPAMILAQIVGMQAYMVGAQSNSDELKLATQVISDACNNIRTVRSTGAEENLLGLVEKYQLPVLKAGMKRSLFAGASFGLSQAVTFLVFALGFWWAGDLIDRKVNTFREALVAMNCLLFATFGIGSLAGFIGDVGKAKVACHDLFKLLDRESEIDGLTPTGTIPTCKNVGTVEFEQVKFAYPFRAEVQVLKSVTFKVSHGDSVGLVGPSGGGKSTIFALLQRFYDPAAGGVFISDSRVPLKDIDIRWWRSQIGVVGQEPILFDTTVRENIMYGDPNAAKDWVDQCVAKSKMDFLREQGLDTQVGPKGSRLSGGQKQRVAICRALVRDPAIMILDEATSALDSASETVVQAALNECMQGRTSFSIAHRLSTIRSSKVILVCAEGSIVETGSHNELMAKRGLYYKLHGH